jgi:hypothetical protein
MWSLIDAVERYGNALFGDFLSKSLQQTQIVVPITLS